MKPYYQDSAVTIYYGDCLEIMPKLEAESVDLVLTDPPYGVDYVTNHRARGDVLVHEIAGDSSLKTYIASIYHAARLLKQDRHWYSFAAPLSTSGELLEALALAGLSYKNLLVWDKQNQSVGDLTGDYGRAWEPIIFAHKGRRDLFGSRDPNILRFSRGSGATYEHPTQKPVKMMQYLIQTSTLQGELIVEPFMGGGGVVKAAKDLGRRAIGIEIEERYCEIAAKRCAQEVLDLSFAGTEGANG